MNLIEEDIEYVKFYNLVKNYTTPAEDDFNSSYLIYKEVRNINIFKLDDVNYNLFYTNSYVNNIFKVLYRLLEGVEDGIVMSDKNFRFLKFDETVKLIYHIKRKVINPLVNEIFSSSAIKNAHEKNLSMKSVILQESDEDSSSEES